ncbi:ATP-binding protein [Nocardia paucivorans]|uniref:ATP-binding protein n=1 Tax=Nocardia paucivorans TaxID=114259 RepID=UPI00031FCADC|nr:ATP-binding protein [Nocardia paucivorans]
MAESSLSPAIREITDRSPIIWQGPLPALGVCVLVSTGPIVAAIVSVPESVRVLTTVWMTIAAALVCAAVTAAVYFRGVARAAEAEAVAANVRAADAEARAAVIVESAAARQAEAKASERRRAAATAAMANAAGRMQAMTTGMLATLRDLEHRYSEHEVLADLLKLDHDTARAGRLADSIAILSGARTGRRWAKPIEMERVLRAAMGRVSGYQRVRLRAVAAIAVVGHAAEGVIHALAELVDNACQFSPPTTEVHIYAAEVPAGVVVTIEDSGLVMSETALRRAQETVSGKTESSADAIQDLSSLNGTRFGLAVVGRLARKHGLTVNYRPSALGGTAAVVVIPRELTTRPENRPQTVRPQPQAFAPPESPESPDPASVADPVTEKYRPVSVVKPADRAHGTHGFPAPPGPPHPRTAPGVSPVGAQGSPSTTPVLPQRRRGHTLAAAHPEGLPAPAPAGVPMPVHPPSPSALGAFQRAVTGRGNEAAVPSPSSQFDARENQ